MKETRSVLRSNSGFQKSEIMRNFLSRYRLQISELDIRVSRFECLCFYSGCFLHRYLNVKINPMDFSESPQLQILFILELFLLNQKELVNHWVPWAQGMLRFWSIYNYLYLSIYILCISLHKKKKSSQFLLCSLISVHFHFNCWLIKKKQHKFDFKNLT